VDLMLTDGQINMVIGKAAGELLDDPA